MELIKVFDLDYFTPELEGYPSLIFMALVILVFLTAFVVQRAVFKTLKRLGSRYINQMIIPSQVIRFLDHFQLRN